MSSATHDSWTVTAIRLIVSASLAVMTFPVMAERANVWSRQYVVSVPFNESTSKASARSMALERARGLAANEFGSGVFTEEELKDGELRQRTRVVTAGVTKMRVTQESYHQDERGVVSGEYHVEVEISGDELQRQLDAMRRDASRDQRLLTLKRENEVLAARLKSREGAAQAEVIALSDLLNNSTRGSAPEIVFPRGELVSLAVRSDQSQSIWNLIEEGLFEPLRNADYNISLEKAELEGDAVKVKLQVRWSLNLTFMRAKSFNYAPTYSQLPGAQYAEGFCFQPRSEPQQIYRDLMSQAVWLEVAIGSQRNRFMVGGPMESYWCVANGAIGIGKQIEMSIPIEEAKNAGEIKSRLVRGGSNAGPKVSELNRDLMRSVFYRR